MGSFPYLHMFCGSLFLCIVWAPVRLVFTASLAVEMTVLQGYENRIWAKTIYVYHGGPYKDVPPCFANLLPFGKSKYSCNHTEDSFLCMHSFRELRGKSLSSIQLHALNGLYHLNIGRFIPTPFQSVQFYMIPK